MENQITNCDCRPKFPKVHTKAFWAMLSLVPSASNYAITKFNISKNQISCEDIIGVAKVWLPS